MYPGIMRVRSLRYSFYTIVLLCSSMAIAPTTVGAQTMLVAAPYGGALSSSHQDNGVDMSDTKFMEGIFFQAIDPAAGQVNTFLYHVADPV